MSRLQRIQYLLSVVIFATSLVAIKSILGEFAPTTVKLSGGAKTAESSKQSGANSEISPYRPKQQYIEHGAYADAIQNQWSNSQMFKYGRHPDMIAANSNAGETEIEAPRRKDSGSTNGGGQAQGGRQAGLRSLFELISSGAGRNNDDNDDQMSDDEALYLGDRSQLEENLRNYQLHSPKMEKFQPIRSGYDERASYEHQQRYQAQQEQNSQQQIKNVGPEEPVEPSKRYPVATKEMRSPSKEKIRDETEQIDEQHSSASDTGYLRDSDRGRLFEQQQQSQRESAKQPERAFVQPVNANVTSSLSDGPFSPQTAEEMREAPPRFSGGDTFGNRKLSYGLTKTDLAIEYLRSILKNRQSLLRAATAKFDNQGNQVSGAELSPKSNSTDSQSPREHSYASNNFTTSARNKHETVKEAPAVSSGYQDKFEFPVLEAGKEKAKSHTYQESQADSYEKHLLLQQNIDEYRRKVAANNQFVPIQTMASMEEKFNEQQVQKSQQHASIDREPIYQYPRANNAPAENVTAHPVRPSPPPVNFLPASDNQSESLSKDSVEKLHQNSGFPHLSHGTPLGGDYVESLDEAPRGLRSIMQQTQELAKSNRSDYGIADIGHSGQQANEMKSAIHSLGDILFTSTEPRVESKIPIPNEYKNELVAPPQTLFRTMNDPRAGPISDSSPSAGQRPYADQPDSGASLSKQSQTVQLESSSPDSGNVVKVAASDKNVQSSNVQSNGTTKAAENGQLVAASPKRPQDAVHSVRLNTDALIKQIKSDQNNSYHANTGSFVGQGEPLEPKETKANFNFFAEPAHDSEADMYGPDIKLSNTLYGLHGAEQSLTDQEVEAIRQQLFLQQHQQQQQPKGALGAGANEYFQDNLSNVGVNAPVNQYNPYSVDAGMPIRDNEYMVTTPQDDTSGEKKYYSMPDTEIGHHYQQAPGLQFGQAGKYGAQSNVANNQDGNFKEIIYNSNNNNARPINLPHANVFSHQEQLEHQDFAQALSGIINDHNKAAGYNLAPIKASQHEVPLIRGDYGGANRHEYGEQQQNNNGPPQQHSNQKPIYSGQQDSRNSGYNQDDMRVMDSFMSNVRSENIMDGSALDIGQAQPQVLIESLANGAQRELLTGKEAGVSLFQSPSSLSATDLQKALEEIEKTTNTKQKYSDNNSFSLMSSPLIKPKKNDTVSSKKHQFTNGAAATPAAEDDSKKKSLIVYLNHPRLNDIVPPSSAANKQQSTNSDGYSLAQTIGVDDMPDLTKLGSGSADSFFAGDASANKTDTDGLSVVVVGDAHKYKKIVLLISSKSGGLKFLPMIKEMS